MRLVLQILETNTHKKQKKKKKKKKKKKNYFPFCINYESRKYRLSTLFLKKFRLNHHTSCNWKLIIFYPS